MSRDLKEVRKLALQVLMKLHNRQREQLLANNVGYPGEQGGWCGWSSEGGLSKVARTHIG